MPIENIGPNEFYTKDGKLYLKNQNGVPGMLLIWAHWCGHCQRFKPTYTTLSQQLGNSFRTVAIEESELKKSPELSKALEFQYFPTIKFFDQNGMILGSYEGNRDIPSILKHICEVYHHCIAYH